MAARNPRLTIVDEGHISIPWSNSGPDWVMCTQLGPVPVGMRTGRVIYPCGQGNGIYEPKMGWVRSRVARLSKIKIHPVFNLATLGRRAF